VSGLLLIYVFYYLLGLAPDPTGRIDVFAATPPDIPAAAPPRCRAGSPARARWRAR
jgi:hypothetical protein